MLVEKEHDSYISSLSLYYPRWILSFYLVLDNSNTLAVDSSQISPISVTAPTLIA